MPFLAQRASGVLCLDDVAQLVQRQAEQVLQPQDLLQTLHVGVRVQPVAACAAIHRARQQPELLVVADGPRGGPGPLRGFTDTQPRGWEPDAARRAGHAAAPSAGRAELWCGGRSSDTAAPTSDVAASA